MTGFAAHALTIAKPITIAASRQGDDAVQSVVRHAESIATRYSSFVDDVSRGITHADAYRHLDLIDSGIRQAQANPALLTASGKPIGELQRAMQAADRVVGSLRGVDSEIVSMTSVTNSAMSHRRLAVTELLHRAGSRAAHGTGLG